MEKIVEYEDTDRNGEYNPNTDVVVSQFRFPVQARWEKITSVVTGSMYQLNTTTLDTVVSLRWSSASYITLLPDGSLVTPNATKLEIEITNYPYESPTSKLAIKGYIATDGIDEGDSVEIQDTFESHIILGTSSNKGFFTWSNMAVAVFDGLHQQSNVQVGFKIDPVYKLPADLDLGLAKAILGTATSIRDVHFSFPDYSNPSYVKWYVATGYGEPPHNNPADDAIVVVVLFLTMAVPAVILFAVVRYLASRSQNSSETPVLSSSVPESQLPSQREPLIRQNIRRSSSSLLIR